MVQFLGYLTIRSEIHAQLKDEPSLKLHANFNLLFDFFENHLPTFSTFFPPCDSTPGRPSTGSGKSSVSR